METSVVETAGINALVRISRDVQRYARTTGKRARVLGLDGTLIDAAPDHADADLPRRMPDHLVYGLDDVARVIVEYCRSPRDQRASACA